MAELDQAIKNCSAVKGSNGARLFTELLEAAIDGWTETLIASDNQDESMRLKGAIREVNYLLKRVEEPQIEPKPNNK